MNEETINYVKERANTLASDESAKQTTKDAASAWLDAAQNATGAKDFEAATAELLDYLTGRPHTIDEVIAFAQGPAVELFGEEGAAQYLANQEIRKAQGAKFCDCPACTAASEILAKFGRIEL